MGADLRAAETWIGRLYRLMSGIQPGTPLATIPRGISIAGVGEGEPGNVVVSPANANGVITFGAVAGVRHVVSGFAWSYDADPTGGRITITSGGVALFDMDVTTGGAGKIEFPRGKVGGAGLDYVLTIYAGGAGIVGKLNALDYWTQ